LAMATRVLLVNPNQMQPPIAPIGLDYLADALTSHGSEVKLLDLCFVTEIAQPIFEAIRGFRPHAICLTVRNTDDCYYSGQDFILPRIKQVIDLLRQKSGAPIIVGGVGFSIAPRETFEFMDADYGVVCDGEDTICAVVDRVGRRESFAGIPGLVYREKGKIVSNLPAFTNLAEISPRRRCFVDNKRYFAEGGQIGFETKRGCTMACIYCADPVAKGRINRLRPPALVVGELKALVDQGIDHFHTCDSEFNLPEEHAIAVCEAIADAGLGHKIKWYAYCAPTPFSHTLAGAMKEAGCAGIDFGVDSGDDEMLANYKRHFKSDDLRRTAKLCREHGMPFMYDLLLGGPGETSTTVKRSINLMKEIGPDCVGVSIGMRIYEGTRIADLVRNSGPMESNPNLQGATQDNPSFLKPVFYVSSSVGPDIVDLVRQFVAGDPRFFFADSEEPESNYNYNNNNEIAQAIKRGYRGAYWDILRRLRLEKAQQKPTSASEETQ
jgi:tryptophan 2-C-methyltransferase